MSRAPCTFRQRDVTAALKAGRDAGFQSVRVEVELGTGKIVVIASDAPPPAEADRSQEWEGATL